MTPEEPEAKDSNPTLGEWPLLSKRFIVPLSIDRLSLHELLFRVLANPIAIPRIARMIPIRTKVLSKIEGGGGVVVGGGVAVVVPATIES